MNRKPLALNLSKIRDMILLVKSCRLPSVSSGLVLSNHWRQCTLFLSYTLQKVQKTLPFRRHMPTDSCHASSGLAFPKPAFCPLVVPGVGCSGILGVCQLLAHSCLSASNLFLFFLSNFLSLFRSKAASPKKSLIVGLHAHTDTTHLNYKNIYTVFCF